MFFLLFFNDTATTEIYTLSLHDALPIYRNYGKAGHKKRRTKRLFEEVLQGSVTRRGRSSSSSPRRWPWPGSRSEEHTSELQSHVNLVCRLLLEKKKKKK